MRRRLLDRGKLERLPIKKPRVTETVPSSSFPHWKIFIGWLALLLLDSMADFRFEYLYPACMFLRTVYDSYRYQGLIFAVLILCLVFYLDLLCWTVLAGPWLFLGASSCVWLEIIRSSDHSFSYSALTLWMLFLYVEVSFRLEKLPGHLLNFSRPFAAHCIGYPVVTMSFLIKHQITHVIRQRQQKRIAEENLFYFDILQKALPQEANKSIEDNGKERNSVEELSPTGQPSDHGRDSKPRVSPKAAQSGKSSSRERTGSSSGRHSKSGSSRTAEHRSNSSKAQPAGDQAALGAAGVSVPNGDVPRPSSAGKVHVVGGKKQCVAVKAVPRSDQPQATATTVDAVKDKMRSTLDMLQTELRSERQLRQEAEATASKLELEVKKLKADLQASCLQEEETISRVDQLMVRERNHRLELQRLKTESDNLQFKVAKLSSGKTHDQASIAVLEKKLKEEEGGRQRVEAELREHLNVLQNLCSEEELHELRERLSVKEKDWETARKELQQKQRQVERLQHELNSCRGSLQVAKKEQNQLAHSLNEETGLKMRLFKALSELSRKHQSCVEELQRKTIEVDRLRQRLAEIMAIVPTIPPPVHPPTTAAPFQPTTVAPFPPTTVAPFTPATVAQFPPTSVAPFPPTTVATFPPPPQSTAGHFPPHTQP